MLDYYCCIYKNILCIFELILVFLLGKWCSASLSVQPVCQFSQSQFSQLSQSVMIFFDSI